MCTDNAKVEKEHNVTKVLINALEMRLVCCPSVPDQTAWSCPKSSSAGRIVICISMTKLVFSLFFSLPVFSFSRTQNMPTSLLHSIYVFHRRGRFSRSLDKLPTPSSLRLFRPRSSRPSRRSSGRSPPSRCPPRPPPLPLPPQSSPLRPL
jgi:hypothetical protein